MECKAGVKKESTRMDTTTENDWDAGPQAWTTWHHLYTEVMLQGDGITNIHRYIYLTFSLPTVLLKSRLSLSIKSTSIFFSPSWLMESDDGHVKNVKWNTNYRHVHHDIVLHHWSSFSCKSYSWKINSVNGFKHMYSALHIIAHTLNSIPE